MQLLSGFLNWDYSYLLALSTISGGLAKPAPVIETFCTDELVLQHVKLDGVVTLVDSKHAMQHLNEIKPRFVVNEAVEQIAYADCIIFEQADRFSAKVELEILTKRIQHINGMAQMKQAKFGSVDMDFILGVGGYDLDRIDSEVQVDNSCSITHQHETGKKCSNHHHHHNHVHNAAVTSVTIVFEGTLDIDETYISTYHIGRNSMKVFYAVKTFLDGCLQEKRQDTLCASNLSRETLIFVCIFQVK
ncbi:zinc-regulated GTPase metalloprotein activator 1-like [Humulus lupulus]|uniref:zinc-regulated GTPase metalloprotein activator 1-like n=1 Tax=Humulus lupulus TaxID=3486 RepID=UPI002B40714B|nr:zinc-regulated GTPase metalloprotein activator 1-like [Humulus lupulus]